MSDEFEVLLVALGSMIFVLLSLFLGLFVDRLFALFVFGCPIILMVYGIRHRGDYL